jgi:hypothetical protein
MRPGSHKMFLYCDDISNLSIGKCEKKGKNKFEKRHDFKDNLPIINLFFPQTGKLW